MKTNSIFFKIRIAFGISAFLILSVFTLVYFIESHHQDMELHQRAMQAARVLKHLREDEADMQSALIRLKELDFSLPDEQTTQNALSSGKVVMKFERMGPLQISKYSFDGKRYILIEAKENVNILEDAKTKSSFMLVLLGALVAVLAVLALFYRSILNNLKPLKELTHRVEGFAKSGELSPPSRNLCAEIESVSNAFDNTATHLSNISKARSLFLRNIAHELKTPLSKGRFLTELVGDNGLKERFENLFIRLEVIIGELLSVERLTSGGLTLNKKEYSISDLLAEAIDTAFLDEENVDIKDTDATLEVDFKLFVIALKNLLDNGVKFSNDKKVKVSYDGKTLIFSNSGAPLVQNFELLGEAFVKGDESSDGLGLGLYIVRQILDVHGFALSYQYVEGRHYFLISF